LRVVNFIDGLSKRQGRICGFVLNLTAKLRGPEKNPPHHSIVDLIIFVLTMQSDDELFPIAVLMDELKVLFTDAEHALTV